MRGAWLLLIAVACHGKSSVTSPELAPLPAYEPGGGPPSPLLEQPPPPETQIDLAERAASVLRALAGEVRAAGSECATVTERVNAFSLARQPELIRLRRDLAAASETDRAAVEAELSRRLASELAAIRVASEHCPDADWDLF